MGKLTGGGGTTNSKKDTGLAKKAAVEQKKQDAADRVREAQEAAEWSRGANTKRSQIEEEKALKADEMARKRREKEELLAAEEAAAMNSGAAQGRKLLVAAAAAKKKATGKPKSDLAALEDALQSSADKAAKKKKADLAAKKQREEEAAAAKAAEAARQRAAMDPLLVNTEAMLMGMLDDEEGVGREANQARMEAAGTSGIDAALGHLNVSSSSNGAVISSAKALYNAFEARMMPIVKEEHPGLRLSQYKEKIFALWKKSPENPANRLAADKNNF